LDSLIEAFDRTSEDIGAWTEVCELATSLMDSVGTVVLPANSQMRRPILPRSNGISEALQHFSQPYWLQRDPRLKGFHKSLVAGYVTDADIVAYDELPRHPFYLELQQFDLKWFAMTSVEIKGEIWGLAINRGMDQQPFEPAEIKRLMAVRSHFAAAARRAAFLGGRRIDTIEQTFATSRRGVFILDWTGRVVRMNPEAERLVARHDLVRAGRFQSGDPQTARILDERSQMAVRYCARTGGVCPPPVTIETAEGTSLSVDAIPLPRDYHSLVANACAIITIHEVASPAVSPKSILMQRYGLTARESQLAVHLAAGETLAQFADMQGLSVATARQHLKSVFAKTLTHRQAELVVFVNRLG
jgi:DNA-binding CsgD family transcriptional regulator/PAS domain-containing protein